MIVPEGVDVDQPIDVEWDSGAGRTMVTVTMGGACIIIDTTPEGAVNVPLLIQALPSILDRAYDHRQEAAT
jgi:hypothetical protein